MIKGTSDPAGSMFNFLKIIGRIIPTKAAVIQETIAATLTTIASLIQNSPRISAIKNIPKPTANANKITVINSL